MVTDPDLRYPIGRFTPPSHSRDARPAALLDLVSLPEHARAAVSGLTESQLDTPYRPGGWTVRQVIHHLADSHANAFIRLKLALTETDPTVKPYDERAWAELPDSRMPVDASLQVLDGLHRRWAALYEGLEPVAFERRFFHPEHGRYQTIDEQLCLYGWHSRHHVAHITALRQRAGW